MKKIDADSNKIDADSLKDFARYNQVILKSQRRFKSDQRNVFTEEINKIALRSNDVKRIQSIDCIRYKIRQKHVHID